MYFQTKQTLVLFYKGLECTKYIEYNGQRRLWSSKYTHGQTKRRVINRYIPGWRRSVANTQIAKGKEISERIPTSYTSWRFQNKNLFLKKVHFLEEILEAFCSYIIITVSSPDNSSIELFLFFYSTIFFFLLCYVYVSFRLQVLLLLVTTPAGIRSEDIDRQIVITSTGLI